MFIYYLFVGICMAFERKILDLDKKTKKQVKETLKAIEIALKLNSASLKGKKVPEKLQKLVEWKGALEGWQANYGQTHDVIAMAEGLGAYHEICMSLG
jgi:hypothetical protein